MRVLLALALLAVLAPAAMGWSTTRHGTISTLEWHTHGAWLLCGRALYAHEVRLTLLDPSPGDQVLLAVHEYAGYNAPQAEVASFERPSVRVLHRTVFGCSVVVEVVGLRVEGEAPYRLDIADASILAP